MHDFNSYQQCLVELEFEVERFKELAVEKFLSSVIIIQAKVKKNGKGANKRKEASKPNVLENEGASLKKKKAYYSRKSDKGVKSKVKCHHCRNLVILRVTACSQKRYTIITKLHLFVAKV